MLKESKKIVEAFNDKRLAESNFERFSPKGAAKSSEANDKKRCIVCGEPITGRSDKKYCSVECRSYHNNLKRRTQLLNARENKEIKKLKYNVLVLAKRGCKRSIKIITGLSQIFKIMTNFRKD